MARDLPNILLVDDDLATRDPLAALLRAHNLVPIMVNSVGLARRELMRARPTLMILEIQLPDENGLEFCLELKNSKDFCNLPLILLSRISDEQVIVDALRAGVDDYMIKPFRPLELITRINKAIKPHLPQPFLDQAQSKDVLLVAPLTLNLGKRELRLESERVDLTYTEFEVLHLFMKNPGWVFTRPMIMQALHGEIPVGSDRTVDVQIVSLRKKLGRYESLIETVRGVGYRLQEPTSQSHPMPADGRGNNVIHAPLS